MRRLKALRCFVLSHKWAPRHNDEEPYRECRRCGKRDFVNYHPAADLERVRDVPWGGGGGA
jgi:hypothetical protein